MKSYDLKLTVTARVNLSQEDIEMIAKETNRGELTKEAQAAMKATGISEISADNVDLWLPLFLGKATRSGVKRFMQRDSEGDFKGIQVSGGFTPRGSKGGSDE